MSEDSLPVFLWSGMLLGLTQCCPTYTRLYCGFEDAIEIFDVQRPGEGERLSTTPSKKSKDGLKGEQSVVDHTGCA